MKKIRKYLPYIIIVTIFISGFFIWYRIYSANTSKYLKVVFLDVGQGDAIYIEAPNRKQILIDGGKDAKLLSSLAKVMPFADRSIDMVITTHPDADHIGGLPVLLDYYKVENILENGAVSDSSLFSSLEERIAKKKINKTIAHRGMHLILDEERNIYLDILFPDREASLLESNEASVVIKLVYGESSFMFMGDASLYTENLIEWNEKPGNLDVDVLKLGHHGARTSSSELWLEATSPEVAIISAGKDNSYGHPHKEVLDRLKKLNIPFLSTIDKGNIIFKTDGVKIIKPS